MKKVIVIVGPTGVGKTKLGVEVAKCFDGEIISGDSMQIYKGMDIGTAKVTKEETQGIVHRLIDIKEPGESYSAKDFQDQVRYCIDEISKKGKVPIIVGGTGLYIKAALYDYEFNDSSSQYAYYQEKYIDYSNEQLYQYLQQIDTSSAKELHFNNRQRVLRAIEIYESTGIKKSETIDAQNHTCLYDAVFVGLTMDREQLYHRINTRVERMIEQGLQEEVRGLLASGYTKDLQSMKAIGYKEWFAYFEGIYDKQRTQELIQKNSRNYAKRQYTWFKNQFNVRWMNVDINCFENTIQEVIDMIKG